MVFDTWGGVLTPRDYKEFSLRYMQKIVQGLTREADGRKVPVILFTKNWRPVAGKSVAGSGCDALGIDWTTDLKDARQRVGDKVALQGNMDPAILYASPERIRAEVGTILENYGNGSGLVFNLGHGIHQHIDPDKVTVLVESVHEQSKKYHV